MLQTAERLKDLPATLDAIRDGTLSRAQAAAVADAAAVAPAAEGDLLAVAEKESLKGLQDEAARRKVAHRDEQARDQRVHASRHVRFGTEPDGAATMGVRTTVDAMAEIKAAVAHHQQAIFETARARRVARPVRGLRGRRPVGDGPRLVQRAATRPSGSRPR